MVTKGLFEASEVSCILVLREDMAGETERSLGDFYASFLLRTHRLDCKINTLQERFIR